MSESDVDKEAAGFLADAAPIKGGDWFKIEPDEHGNACIEAMWAKVGTQRCGDGVERDLMMHDFLIHHVPPFVANTMLERTCRAYRDEIVVRVNAREKAPEAKPKVWRDRFLWFAIGWSALGLIHWIAGMLR